MRVRILREFASYAGLFVTGCYRVLPGLLPLKPAYLLECYQVTGFFLSKGMDRYIDWL